jgi:pimeloyl-ACP methyl ester carboxylesterase
MKTYISGILSLGMVALVARDPESSQAPRRGTFVLVSANADTVAIESFERSAERLKSTLVFRAAGARFDFELGLAPDRSASWFRNEFRQSSADPGSRPVQSAHISFAGDSAIVVIEPGSTNQRLRTRRGAIPLLNPSFALVEQIVRRALLLGADTTIPVFMVQGGTTVQFRVRRHTADSVLVDATGVVARLAVSGEGSILGGTVPAQGLRIVRTDSVGLPLLVEERPDYSAPPDAPYSAEEVVVVARDSSRLRGTLTIPRQLPLPVPAAVTISGSGLQDRDSAIPLVPGYRPFRQIADALGRAGVAVLRLDDRGFGASENKSAAVTTETLAGDVAAALDYLSTRPEIDSSRLSLLGHSEGALIAPMVAYSDPRVRALVLMASPASPGRTIIEWQNRYLLETVDSLGPTQRDSLLRVSMRIVDSAAARQPWLGFFLHYDPLPLARQLRIPVLVLHGGTDRQVPPSEGEKLASAMREGGNGDVTFVLFPRKNHLFLDDPSGDWRSYSTLPTRTLDSDVLGRLTAWLVSRLR